MKSYRVILWLIPVLLTSCEKEDFDYRYEYTGKYHFEIEQKHTGYVGDEYSGHFETTTSNNSYNGSVRIYLLQSNELKVDWGTKTFYTYGGEIDQHKAYLTVDSEGNLDCPDASAGFGTPAYIHGDTIQFAFFSSGGMAGRVGTSWHVTGLKR
jgi:hypothetical protein